MKNYLIAYKHLQLKCFILILSFLTIALEPLAAVPLVESTTGLQVEAPKNYSIVYNNDGTYTVKKKKSKNKATFTIGFSPMSLKLTADDFVARSGFKINKYEELNDSILLKLEKLGKKKNVSVRFRAVGNNGEMEITTYTGPKKKAKPKRNLKSRVNQNQRITAGAINAFDRIIRSRQGGLRIQLPVNIPTRQLVGFDGTSAVVPNLPGWTFEARDGIISGGNRNQGVVNLGIPTTVLYPGTFNGPVVNAAVPPGLAIQQIWPQQVAQFGINVQVLAVQQIPGTDGWLGPNFFSGLFAVRYVNIGRVWQGLMVSGVAPIPGSSFSWLWYHSYIAVPEVGGSQVIGNALMNTWSTWNNENANAIRLQNALNTIATTPLPGNPIDPVVFDRIQQSWVNYIKE